ncbi:hypothetical protein [Micromonospora sp. NPDC001898]
MLRQSVWTVEPCTVPAGYESPAQPCMWRLLELVRSELAGR